MTELLGEELWSTALSQPKDNNDDEDDLPSGEVNIHHFSPTLRGIIVLVYTTQVYFLQMIRNGAKQSGKPLYFAWR